MLTLVCSSVSNMRQSFFSISRRLKRLPVVGTKKWMAGISLEVARRPLQRLWGCPVLFLDRSPAILVGGSLEETHWVFGHGAVGSKGQKHRGWAVVLAGGYFSMNGSRKMMSKQRVVRRIAMPDWVSPT